MQTTNDSAKNRILRILSVALWMAIAAAPIGCAKSGIGRGVAVGPDGESQEIIFRWSSGASALHGDISTTLPSGEYFQGQFLQITSTTELPLAAPFYNQWYSGWGPRWDAGWWAGPYGFGARNYVRNYSGQVVANLTSGTGSTMRCRFYLNKPSAGLADGGQGECKTSDGTTVEAATLMPAGSNRSG